MMIRLLLDDLPHTYNQFEVNDYSSKVVLGCLYEPLFFYNNDTGSYDSKLVYSTENNKQIIFKMKDFIWSNGKKMQVYDIFKSLHYILENKTLFCNYLNFIEGVEDYLDGENTINDVSIHIEDRNTLIIKKAYNYNYKNLFSSIQFSPAYFDENNKKESVYSGAFVLSEVENKKITLKRNPYYNRGGIPEYIEFILEKDPDVGLEMYNNFYADMTCSTAFNFKNLDILRNNSDFFIKRSNIELNLIFNDKNLLQFKEELRIYIYNCIENNTVLCQGIETNKMLNLIDNTVTPFNCSKKKFTIIYPDYYPNNYIIDYLDNFFQKYNIKLIKKGMSLEDFMEEDLENINNDIILCLISPLINEDIEYWISYINYFDGNYQDEYIELLNEYIDSTIKKAALENFVSEHSNRIPLANIKHIYLKRDTLNCYHVDHNDLFRFNFEGGII